MISRLIFGKPPRPTWPHRLAANILAVPLVAWLVMLLAGAAGKPVGYWWALLLATFWAVVLDMAETAWFRYRWRRP